MLMIISIFYIGFTQHCTACFYVTNLRTHLFLTKFHTYLLISPKPVVAVSGASSLGSVGEGQLLISFFSIKLHFLLRLEIDRWILRCCQSIISAKCCQHIVYWQYLLIKATTLFFCMECSETQVATACMINWRKLCTVPYDAQISDCIKQCAIFRPLRNRPNKPANDVTFAPRFCVVSRWLPANKAVIFDYVSDPGLRRFHVICFFIAPKYCQLWFECCKISVIGNET